MDKKQRDEKTNYSLLNQFIWWKLDPTQLKKQVNEYTTLKVYKSFKGIAVLFIAGWVFLTKFFSIIHWIPNNKFIVSLFVYEDIGIFSLIFYLFLMVFVYKGKRWAIVIAMIIQTLNSGYALLSSILLGNIDIIFWLMIVFWWALFMKFFYAAFKVEQLRNNVRKSTTEIVDTVREEKQSFLKQKSNLIPLLILKEINKKILIISSGLLLLTGWFYWFQWRPAKIIHDCSWKKIHIDVVPAQPAKSPEDVYRESGETFQLLFDSGVEKLEGSPAKPAVPAHDIWQKASEEQYKFCLHDKGLR